LTFEFIFEYKLDKGTKGGTTTDRGLAKAALQSKARKSTIKCK